MSRTIPLPAIIEDLARVNGCSPEMARAFLEEFASQVTVGLRDKGTVTVKEIGTFRRIETSDGATCEFAPSRELAEAVNAPFSMFEAVELDEDVTEEMLDRAARLSPDDAENVAAEVADTVVDEAAPAVETPQPATEEIVETAVEVAAESVEVEAPEVPAPTPDEAPAPVAAAESVATAETETPAPAATPSVVEDTPAQSPSLSEEAGEKPSAPSRQAPNPAPITPAAPAPAASAPAAPKLPPIPPRKPAAPQRPTPPPPRPQARRAPEPVLPPMPRRRGPRRVTLASLVAATLLALMVGVAAGYFAYHRINLAGVKSVNISAEDVQVIHAETPDSMVSDSSSELPAVAVAPPDSAAVGTVAKSAAENPVASSATVPAPAGEVTDTVRAGYFLTTMAQRHYGKKKFWVYIYLENQGKLGNPDNVPLNTVVVVPPAEKYGIKPGDKASEADAERKSAEIIGRYSK